VLKLLRALENLQMDVKYLDVIPELNAEYVHKLPKYQFTARCVYTGAAFTN